jgi:hypothetical protein
MVTIMKMPARRAFRLDVMTAPKSWIHHKENFVHEVHEGTRRN